MAACALEPAGAPIQTGNRSEINQFYGFSSSVSFVARGSPQALRRRSPDPAYRLVKLPGRQCCVWPCACRPVCLAFGGCGVPVRQSACLPACLSICLPYCMPAFLPVYLSALLSACLPACLSVYWPVCLPVCLSVCLPVCLSICLSACLSVCLELYRESIHTIYILYMYLFI